MADRVTISSLATAVRGAGGLPHALARSVHPAREEIGFWQIACRDDDPQRETMLEAPAGKWFAVHLLYGDHEGGQRVILALRRVVQRCRRVEAVRRPALAGRPRGSARARLNDES
ncbi:MAG: hypothetical protein ACYDCH_13125 [Gaiellaceae bacterium]